MLSDFGISAHKGLVSDYQMILHLGTILYPEEIYVTIN